MSNRAAVVSLCVGVLGASGGVAWGQPTLREFPTTGSALTRGKDISNDGARVAWDVETSSSGTANRWTTCGGSSEYLGSLPGTLGDSHSLAISGDGTTVVGYSTLNSLSVYAAFRWTAAGGLERVGELPGFSGSFAYGVSYDGSVVVGVMSNTPVSRAFRWTPSGGTQNLGALGTGTASVAYTVSDDGLTVAGASDQIASSGTWVPTAFRWTPSTGMQPLTLWSGVTSSLAYAMSGDGEVIGGSCDMGQTGRRTFRWTQADGAQELPRLAGSTSSHVLCMNTDGSVIAGFAIGSAGMTAMFWDSNGQPRDLREHLQQLGVSVAEWNLEAVSGVSADGTSMVGWGTRYGQTRGWVLTGTSVPSSPATVGTQPVSSNTTLGGATTFWIEASGGPIDYQWRRGGTPLTDGARIHGSATPSLVISGVQSSDQGAYDCIVTNTCGPATSTSAELSCRAVVTIQPSGGAFHGGETVVLAPTVGTSGATTYRWKKDNINLFNSGAYSGVTTQTLTIHANDPSQSGSYTLAITNPCGGTTTVPAVVEVSCAADWNRDGGVDGDDAILFFQQWDENNAAADFNGDSGVDGDDAIEFFGRWDAGC